MRMVVGSFQAISGDEEHNYALFSAIVLWLEVAVWCRRMRLYGFVTRRCRCNGEVARVCMGVSPARLLRACTMTGAWGTCLNAMPERWRNSYRSLFESPPDALVHVPYLCIVSSNQSRSLQAHRTKVNWAEHGGFTVFVIHDDMMTPHQASKRKRSMERECGAV